MKSAQQSLKVIHVINTLETGGAERLISNLLPILKNKGENIELICLTQKVQSSFFDELLKHDIPIHFLSVNRSVYSPLHVWALYLQLKRLKPDIVHAHLFPSFYWVAACRLLFRTRPLLLVTEHSSLNKRVISGRWKIPDRLAYRQFKRIVCISEGVRDAIKRYMPFVETDIIHNGIPVEKYAEPCLVEADPEVSKHIHEIRQDPRHRIVLSIGRLVWQKNQLTMINALAQLPEHVYLVIAGEGELRPQLEQQIAELKLTKRAILLGNQSDISYLIKNADAGILSSVSEGFGLSAVEMMAGGLPVVISSVPGLSEVAADPSLVCEASDPTCFAQTLSRLFEDPSYYSAMTALSLKKASQFSIQQMADKYHSLYHRLLPASTK